MVGQSRWLANALLVPAFGSVALLIAYPLYLVVETSLREGRVRNLARLGEMPLGLGNFRRVLEDIETWSSLWITFLYTAGTLIPSFLLGLALALLLNESFLLRRWLRSLMLLPWAVPGVIVSIIFLWLFDASYGVVNYMLRSVGLITEDVAWFVRADTALIAVIIPSVWKAFPFFTLTILAALQTIPSALYEAARVDGASPTQVFRHVTWPGIRSAALLAAILNALYIFCDFDIIYATTGGGPARATETLAVMVYNEAFSFFRFGPASALGVLMILLATAFVLLAMRPIKRAFF